MGKPAYKLLPPAAVLVPNLLGEQERAFLFSVKNSVEFPRGTRIHDNRVGLVVPRETARIEIGRPDGAEFSIHHDDFRMMKAGLIQPYIASLFHEFMGVVETTVRCQGYIALHAEHDINLHPPLHSIFQCLLDRTVEREIGVYDAYAVLRKAYGIGVKLTYNLVAGTWLAIDDAHHFLTGASCSIRL